LFNRRERLGKWCIFGGRY